MARDCTLLWSVTDIISKLEYLHRVNTVQPVTLIEWFVYIWDSLHFLLTSDMKEANGFFPIFFLVNHMSGFWGSSFSAVYCHMYLLSGCRWLKYSLNDFTGQRGSVLFSGMMPETIFSMLQWFFVSSPRILMTNHSSCSVVYLNSKSVFNLLHVFTASSTKVESQGGLHLSL